MSTYTDGIGVAHKEPLPELDARLLEEVVSWATWDQEQRQLAKQNPQLRDYLKNIPGWDQTSWTSESGETDVEEKPVCGSTFCIAGYTAYATHHVAHRRIVGKEKVAEHWYGENWRAELDAMGESLARVPNALHYDEVVGIKSVLGEDYDDESADDNIWSDMATTLLGLTVGEASHLFDSDAVIDGIQNLAQDIAKSRGLPPLNFDAWTFTKTPTDELWAYFEEPLYQKEISA